jgi:hypothetical protein
MFSWGSVNLSGALKTEVLDLVEPSIDQIINNNYIFTHDLLNENSCRQSNPCKILLHSNRYKDIEIILPFVACRNISMSKCKKGIEETQVSFMLFKASDEHFSSAIQVKALLI